MLNFDQNQPQDPATAYGQLDQRSRSQVAETFIQRFSREQDPQAQQYASLDPRTATPGQLAEMHQYAATQHPGVLGDVMQHPVVTGILGGFATYEVDKRLGGKR